jgi:flagellar motor switch protein FliG
MTMTHQAGTNARRRQPGVGIPAESPPWDHGASKPSSDNDWDADPARLAAQIPPVRKAAILLASLEQSLASQLMSNLDRVSVDVITREIARLDHVDPALRLAVLEEFYGLGLRRLCFGFDDLIKMSDDDIRASLEIDDIQTWSLALAGAPAPARAKVLGALPPSAAERLRANLEELGPFRLSESEAAQLEIAERIRRLYDRGRISLPEPSGQDEFLI